MLNLNSFSPVNIDCSGCAIDLTPCPWNLCQSFTSDWIPISGDIPTSGEYYKNYAPCSWKVSINGAYLQTPVVLGCDQSISGTYCNYLNGDYYIDYSDNGTNKKTAGNKYVSLLLTPNVFPSSVTVALRIFEKFQHYDVYEYDFIGGDAAEITMTKTFPMGNWDCRNLSFNMAGALITNGGWCRINGNDVTITAQYSDYNLFEQENENNTFTFYETNIENNMDFYNYFLPSALVDLTFISCAADYYTRATKPSSNNLSTYLNMFFCSGIIAPVVASYPVSTNYENVFIKSITLNHFTDYPTNPNANISGILLTPTVCFRCSGLNGYMQYKTYDEYEYVGGPTHIISTDIDCLCRNDTRYIQLELAHPSSILILKQENFFNNDLFFTSDTPSGMAPPTSLRFFGIPSNTVYPCRISSSGYIDIELEWLNRDVGILIQKRPLVPTDQIGFHNITCPQALEVTINIPDWTPVSGCSNPSAKPPFGTYVLNASTPGPVVCSVPDYIVGTGLGCDVTRIRYGSVSFGFTLVTGNDSKYYFDHFVSSEICSLVSDNNGFNLYNNDVLGNTYPCTITYPPSCDCWTIQGSATITYMAV